MTFISFYLSGKAIPKGSMSPMINRKTGRMMVVPANSKTLGKWQRAIRKSFKDLPSQPSMISGCVKFEAEYYFVKAKSNKDSAPTNRTVGDLDKLNRTMYDELTKAGFITDDSFITSSNEKKRWSDTGEPYVIIRIDSDELL